MASKPSARGHRQEDKVPPLNVTPVMNLIIILIPALLMSAEFVQLAVINVSAPQIGSGPPPEDKEDEEEKPKLNLSLTITAQGFTVAGSGAVLPSEGGDAGGPTVPKKGEEFDYEALTKKLVAIKDKFPDETQVTVQGEDAIEYKVLIKVMDASRQSADGKQLFPDVILAAGMASG